MTTATMNRYELNDAELEMVNGGDLDRCPQDEQLAVFGLTDIVRCTGGWTDVYYDTYRGDGVWKNVGSEDMMKYVERTLGSDNPTYKDFYHYCNWRHRTPAVYNVRKH